MWWDTRNLSAPTDTLLLTTGANSTINNNNVILGGSSLEYNTDAGPTKYLVGTEQGIVLGVNFRNRKLNNGVSVYDTRGDNTPVPSMPYIVTPPTPIFS